MLRITRRSERLRSIVEVDALGEPRVDARDVAGVREQGVGQREGGADHPAVVRRVDAAGDEPIGAADHEAAEFLGEGAILGGRAGAEQGGSGADALEEEGGVGRGAKVRRVEVDRAVLVLGSEEGADGEAEGFDQFGGAEVTATGSAGGSDEGDDQALGAGPRAGLSMARSRGRSGS